MRGRRIRNEAPRVRLAWTCSGHLILRAEGFQSSCHRTTIPPGDPDFWRQEHLELLYVPAGVSDAIVQILITPWGAWWDNQGWFRRSQDKAPIRVVPLPGHAQRGGFDLTFPLALAGLPSPPMGTALRALIATVGPDPDRADYALSSPTDLGFMQIERFGILSFRPPDEQGVRLDRVSEHEVTLYNPSRRSVHAHVQQEGDTPLGAFAATQPVVIPPRRRVRFPLIGSTSPYRFTTVIFRLVTAEGTWPLGSVTRRGAPAPVRWSHPLRHPYLLDPEAARLSWRQKRKLPLFRRIEHLNPLPSLDSVIPEKEDPNAFLFTPDSREIHWFRVARETMIRDGEGGRRPAAARLWQLQSDAARTAWRDVVRAVTPTEDQLAVLCNELNRLLDRRDLYEASAFRDVALPREGRTLMEKGLDRLSREELRKFNRILLQSAVECIGNYRMDLVQIPGQCVSAWIRSGQSRLIRLATRAVGAAFDHTLLGHEIHLHEGMAAAGLAQAYDLFFPYLSPSDRLIWRRLMRRFLDLYRETAERSSWTVTTIANANAIGNSGCGLLALALLQEEPDLAHPTLAWVRDYLWNWLDYAHGPHGGNTEGAQYWAYALEHFLRFAETLERVTGTDDGLLSHPAVTNAMNMVRNGLTNDGAMSGVNDTIPMPVGGAIGWFTAGRFGDPLGLWYGDHAARWLASRAAQGRPTAYVPRLDQFLLWRPNVPECRRPPPLPTLSWLPETETVLLRSEPRWDAEWIAGLKGARPPFTHHNQADTGSVWLDFQGERMILDPGYYKPHAEDHSLPLIGDTGPQTPSGWEGRIIRVTERNNLRYAVCEATAAYHGRARRVVRHLVLLGPCGAVLLDDIEADEPVRSLFQCGGPVERESRGTWRVMGRRVRLRLLFAGPRGLRAQPLGERSLHDTHWGYHFADCRWFPLEVRYNPTENTPLVTIFTNASSPSTPVRVQRDTRTLEVTLGDQVTIHFAHLASGWVLE